MSRPVCDTPQLFRWVGAASFFSHKYAKDTYGCQSGIHAGWLHTGLDKLIAIQSHIRRGYQVAGQRRAINLFEPNGRSWENML